MYVDVSTNLSTYNYTVGGTSNLLLRLPLMGFGNIQSYEPNSNEAFSFHVSSDISEMRITLRDDNGNLYNLPETHHYTMTMRIQDL